MKIEFIANGDLLDKLQKYRLEAERKPGNAYQDFIEFLQEAIDGMFKNLYTKEQVRQIAHIALNKIVMPQEKDIKAAVNVVLAGRA